MIVKNPRTLPPSNVKLHNRTCLVTIGKVGTIVCLVHGHPVYSCFTWALIYMKQVFSSALTSPHPHTTSPTYISLPLQHIYTAPYQRWLATTHLSHAWKTITIPTKQHHHQYIILPTLTWHHHIYDHHISHSIKCLFHLILWSCMYKS